ncbi:hypothetical protein [Leisingera sp. ANG-M6]|uniref:hypothetical protein n=1 Tax=Leisingera sp. ANG-M6 TaxID=1577900 RepID=UPI00057D8D0F|nr:hypothetical protein [Leisingera sp. ANG-M6]KIC27520.1 hypothetical protein RA24_14905 [Leisingera sp. ANG-M6]
MTRPGPLPQLMLHICFFLFMTRTEFPALGTFAGLSYLLRGLAGAALLVQLVQLHRAGLRFSPLIWAVFISVIFLLSNAADPSPFAVIACFAILTGLLLGGIQHRPGTRALFLRLVRVYLLVNFAGLCLAAAAYYGGGLAIDFHGLMFPWSAARIHEFMGYYRVTGFQIEPGTYTATVYFCALLAAVLRGRLAGRLETAAILSTAITLSAWAVLAILSYLCGCLVEALLNRRRHKALAIAAVLAAAAIPCLLLVKSLDFQNTAYIQYFLDRFETEDASGSMVMKLQAWNAWTARLGTEMLFPHPLGRSFCETCGSPQDLGTLINMLWFAGILLAVPLLLWLAVMAVLHAGPGLLLASLPLIVAKFFFFDPSLWLYFGLLMFLPLTGRRQAGKGQAGRHRPAAPPQDPGKEPPLA